MKCPRCVQKIHRGAESCPRCGFAVDLADEMFADIPRAMPALADRAGLLRLVERNRAKRAMRRFSSRFPELFFAVYTGVFRNHESLRICGFWVLNRTHLENQSDLGNESCVLLVMDAERKAATLSFGYRLDAYLTEDDTFFCLGKAHPHWLEARYDDGIVALIAALEKILIRRAIQAKRDPLKFARRVLSSDAVRKWSAARNATDDPAHEENHAGKGGES